MKNRILIVLKLLIPLTIFLSFIALESLFSFLVWLVIFAIAYFLLKRKKTFATYEYNVFILSYFIISQIGLLYLLDSLSITGYYFGFGNDDYAFFTRVQYLVQSRDIFNFYEYGLYEHILACFYLLIRFFKGVDPNLVDLVTLNWLFVALVSLKITELFQILFKKRIDYIILLISLILNQKFYDSVAHLYRDVFVLYFMVCALIAIHKKNEIQTWIFAFFSGVLRGANFFLILIYYLLKKIVRIKRKYVYGYVMLAMFFALIIFTQEDIVNKVSPYLSGITNLEIYKDRYTDISLEDLAGARQRAYEYVGQGGEMRNLSYSGGIVGNTLKIVMQFFFPVSYNRPYYQYEHTLSFTGQTMIEGFSRIELLKWISITIWVWVFPMFITGFIALIKRHKYLINLAIFYILSLLLVSLISMQHRHGIYFVFMHPLFCQLGHIYKKKFSLYYRASQISIVLFILLWNVYRLLQ